MGKAGTNLKHQGPTRYRPRPAWLATWDERHDELPGRHKARGNSPNGKCGSGSSKGNLRGVTQSAPLSKHDNRMLSNRLEEQLRQKGVAWHGMAR